jgi:hypothetical protein
VRQVRYWLNFPKLADEDWEEVKRKEQAMLAWLEEQDACWLTHSGAGGDTDEDKG